MKLMIRLITVLLCTHAALADSMPMCKVVSGSNGPAILMNGKPVSPLFISFDTGFSREDTLLAEVKEAAKADINLLSFDVPLDWDGTSDTAETTIEKFCAANPNAYIYLRVSLAPTAAWLNAHPDVMAADAEGKQTAQLSFASETWRAEAGRLLDDRVSGVASGPYAARFIGVCLLAPHCGQWSTPDGDYSDSTVNSFRIWLKKTYLNDKSFRKAWGGEVYLKTATPPPPALFDASAWGPFRDPVAQRQAMDFEHYVSDSIANTISAFAAVAKKAMHGRGVVGVYCGCALDPSEASLSRSGQLGLNTVLTSPDINIIHAPYSGLERELGKPGHLPFPVDSAALHNKLVVLDDDTHSHVAQAVTTPPPSEPLLAKNLEETVTLNRRNMANFLTHRAGMSYFDPDADGRWTGKEFWTTATLTRRLFAESRTPEPFQPQIALVVDERSPRILAGAGIPYLLESLANWRIELDRIGAPVGYYLQSDLPRLPDSLHVIVLANAYAMTDPERRAVDKFLARGGTVVWTFAPDVYGESGADLARLSATAGMQIGVREYGGPLTLQSDVTAESWQLAEDWKLRFEVTSRENVHAIAHYDGTESVAVAATPLKGGISVYTAVPRVPVGILRWIGTNSAVHFYCDTPDMVGVFGPNLVVHTGAAGTRTFRLPAKVHAIERLVPHVNLPFATDTDTWQDVLPSNSTVIYRITP